MTTATLTDTQARILRHLRKGWRARQGKCQHGTGLGPSGYVRLAPPGQGAVDYTTAGTMYALEAGGLVREVNQGAQRSWELTADGWAA